MELSATSSNGGGHLLSLWGPPLESVRVTSCYFHLFPKSNNLNKLQFVLGMGGSDGCRNDILFIVWEYDILAVPISGTLGPHRLLNSGTLGPHRLLNRGTLGLQHWSQVYGNYYKQ